MIHTATKQKLQNGKFRYVHNINGKEYITKASSVDYKFAVMQSEGDKAIGGFSKTLEAAQKYYPIKELKHWEKEIIEIQEI